MLNKLNKFNKFNKFNKNFNYLKSKYIRSFVSTPSNLSISGLNDEITRKPLSVFEFILKYVGSIPFVLFGFHTVEANHRFVIMRFGKYERTTEEGLRFIAPVGSNVWKIFLGMQSFKLPNAKVVDKNGTPVNISAIVNYKIIKPEKFVINIKCSKEYIQNQAEAIIKKIASQYPYDSNDGKNLKDEANEISNEMKIQLQKLIDDAGSGIIITDIHLTDLNYAPEIASSMLIKQQAKAYIDAKNEIAKSTVDIVQSTLSNIEKCGITINSELRDKLITNLITVIASGGSIQPVIPITSQD